MPERAFFASPFKPEYRWIRDAVADACRRLGIDFRAVDETVIPGTSIIDAINQEIAQADLAVAVITGLNPNVMYELGRILCNGKPTVILADEPTFGNLPFDIRSFAAIKYDGNAKDQSGLATFVTATLAQARDALSRDVRQKIAGGAYHGAPMPLVASAQLQPPHAPSGAVSQFFPESTIGGIDFERLRIEAERRHGKRGCKTMDIEAYDNEGLRGWRQKLDCPCGDSLTLVIDINGDLKRTKVT